jgi:hypothetical protein
MRKARRSQIILARLVTISETNAHEEERPDPSANAREWGVIRMGLLFTSAPRGHPLQFTHRYRSGPAAQLQAISALPGSVRATFSLISGPLPARPRVVHP